MTRDEFDPLDDEPKPEIDSELAEEPEFELQEDVGSRLKGGAGGNGMLLKKNSGTLSSRYFANGASLSVSVGFQQGNCNARAIPWSLLARAARIAEPVFGTCSAVVGRNERRGCKVSLLV